MDWEQYSTIGVRHEYGRILQSPMKEKGHVVMDLCLPNAEVQRYTHSRSMLQSIPHLYRAIRKSTWGGLVPAFMIDRSEDLLQQQWGGEGVEDELGNGEFDFEGMSSRKKKNAKQRSIDEENKIYAAVLNQLAQGNPSLRRKMQETGLFDIEEEEEKRKVIEG